MKEVSNDKNFDIANIKITLKRTQKKLEEILNEKSEKDAFSLVESELDRMTNGQPLGTIESNKDNKLPSSE